MLLKDLKVNKKKRTKRTLLGRGIGTGLGKTSGKGHKGQKARSGAGKPPWFEGGQQRLTQRIPKSGFNNPFPTEYAVLNVGFLNEQFEAGSVIDRAALLSKGCIKNKRIKIKILGDGDLAKALTVKADKFSKSAEEKITKAGGKAEVTA